MRRVRSSVSLSLSLLLAATMVPPVGALADEHDVGDGASPPCVDAVVDTFDGDALDDRWTVVEPDLDNLTVADGRLSIQTVPGRDFFQDQGTLPNVVVQDLPDGAWTATTQMEWSPSQNFQNAGMVVFDDEDNYLKAGMVHAGSRQFELIKEIGGSASFLGDEGAGSFPAEYWMRLSSDGEVITSTFSEDGETWQDLGTATIAGLEEGRIGVYATNSTSTGATEPPVAHFDTFVLEYPGSAERSVSDGFDGDELDGCRWDRTVRYDPDLLEVADGWLRLTTTATDIFGDDNLDPPNFVLQDVPEGDWTVETRMDTQLERSFQNAGFMLHQDDDNYLKAGIVATNDPGAPRAMAFEMVTEIGGEPQFPFAAEGVPDSTVDDWYLRLTKSGNDYTLLWSADGEDFAVVDESRSIELDDPALGLYAVGTPGQDDPVTIGWEYFELVEDDEPDPDAPSIQIDVDPTEPDGDAGWYVSPVEISLSSDDADASLEWRDGDGDWVAWTEPVIVADDGTYSIEARATGEGGVSDVATASLQLDGTPPQTTATVDGTQEDEAFVGDATVTLVAEDATSGVAETHLREEGDAGFDVYSDPVTFDEPGSYTVEYRSADIAGNVEEWGSTSFEVTAADDDPTPPSPVGDLVCVGDLSDDFSGDSLDTDRWSRIVREDAGAYSVGGGSLTVTAAEADIYGTNDNDAPNIFLQPLPDGAWEATAELTMEAYEAYLQAGLIVYGDDDNYAKMVLQGRDTNQVNPAARIFQFIREEGGQPNEVGDSNTDELGADYPDTVWVRFTSDGSDLNASYSADGVEFTEMPQTKQLAGIEDPHIGLFAISPGPGAVVDAQFHSFELTPDPTAVRPERHSDEFDGDELDGCRWDRVVRYDPDAIEMTGGQLLIDTPPGDIYQDSTDEPENFILQTQPDGDWTVQTRFTEELVTGFSQAGLMVYNDDDNYVKFDVIADANQTGVNRIELRSEVDGQIVGPEPDIEAPDNDGEWWLRLSKEGDSFSGEVSVDGETWIATDASVTHEAVAADGGVGLFTLAVQDDSTVVAFDHFRVDGEEVLDPDPDPDPTEPSVEASLSPSDPDGEDGWYVSPVTISLSSDDDDATLEWRLVGAEDWITWTEPVTVSDDGIYEIEYRATNEAGSSELGTVGFQLDQTPPETTATVDGTTEGDAFVDEASVTLDAEDDLSGVAQTHIREAGDTGFDVYDSPVTYTGEGSYTVEFRSADVAGNVEDWQSVSFAIVEDTDPTDPTDPDPTDPDPTDPDPTDPVRPIAPPAAEICAIHQGGISFPDAPGSGHRYFIDCLAELRIVQGYADGTFGPRDDVSRGQLASFVVRSIEIATGETMEVGDARFPDVGLNSTHGRAIHKLRHAGIIQGYEDGTFRPRQSVTRDQTARYVVNALELVLGYDLARSGTTFPDVAPGSRYASDIDALVTAEIVAGFPDGTFGPREPVTRGQMTRFLGNGLGLLAAEGAYQGG